MNQITMESNEVVLRADRLRKEYGRKRHSGAGGSSMVAVDDVSFALQRQRTLGIVGESGCGKSTVAKMLLGLVAPTSGSVHLPTLETPASATGKGLRRRRSSAVQMVFQDPYDSLSPRATILESVAEPLRVNGFSHAAATRGAKRLLDSVGLSSHFGSQYPFELSGGQRQRVGIARALALEPDVIVLDEPVSALDVSVQSQIMNLLLDLQRDLGVSYVFISHNLAVVEHISDDIAVMYLGRIVEQGPAESIFRSPRHPYTKLLMDTLPIADPSARAPAHAIEPSEVVVPAGNRNACDFRFRCRYATDICGAKRPELAPIAESTEVACFHPLPDARIDPAIRAGALTDTGIPEEEDDHA